MNPPHTRPEPPNTAGIGAPPPARTLVELDSAEALALLAGAGYGRVVFTQHALPAIRPVNHLVDDNQIIFRTTLTASLTTAIRTPPDPVVAYQADSIDPATHLGWSVVVTGLAQPVTDPDRITRYETLLHPWINRPMDTIIGIRAEIITGYRLIPTPR